MAHSRPPINLDQPARLYVADLLLILRIARPTLYKGLDKGRYPKPDGRDGTRPYWFTSTIRAMVNAAPVQSIAPATTCAEDAGAGEKDKKSTEWASGSNAS
jgi:hypothetical protein